MRAGGGTFLSPSLLGVGTFLSPVLPLPYISRPEEGDHKSRPYDANIGVLPPAMGQRHPGRNKGALGTGVFLPPLPGGTVLSPLFVPHPKPPPAKLLNP